jgi:hypothetical protein
MIFPRLSIRTKMAVVMTSLLAIVSQLQRPHCRRNGPVWALENVRRIPATAGAPVMLEGILDISERKRAEQEIAFKAYHDPLTGLPNRALFLAAL